MPAFAEVRLKGLSQGGLLFVWEAQKGLAFGIELIIASQWDVFHVELGWTKQNKWPIQGWFIEPDDDLRGEDGRTRLRRLMGKGPKDLGWEISPVLLPDGALVDIVDGERPLAQLEARAEELVGEALQALETTGLAFFSRVAEAQGAKLRITPASKRT